jgi:hypothetical protein
VGRWLENPGQGPHLHLVPHVGLGGLGALLVVDAALVAAGPGQALECVPPLFVLAAAIVWLLLARSARALGLAQLGLVLLIPACALVAVQQAVLGAVLEAVPRGWALATRSGLTLDELWGRAASGVSACALALALGAQLCRRTPVSARWLLDDGAASEALSLAFRRAAIAAGAIVTASGALAPALVPALVLLAAGVVLTVGQKTVAGLLAAGAVLTLHVLAQSGPAIPPWAGPAMAALGVAVAALYPRLAPEAADPPRWRVRVLYGAAILYALAAGAPTSARMAIGSVSWGAFMGVMGRWTSSLALALTLGAVALGLLAEPPPARSGRRSIELGFAVLAMAACTAFGALAIRSGLSAPSRLLADLGIAFAFATAVVGALAHATAVLSTGASGQAARARDALLLGSFVLGALGSSAGGALSPGQAFTAGCALAAVVGLVSVHAAVRDRTARHIYFVQLALLAIYALARIQVIPGLPPETDALFVLVLAFLLVGVTAIGRSAGVPPLAEATRRFAACLPLLVALLVPRTASGTAALFAGGTGLLYAVLAAVEGSRLFGSLGAAATNLALLIAALAYDVQGREIYLAPVGVFVLMLGQIFRATLGQRARSNLAVVGGLLVYAPAAVKITTGLGSVDGTYAVVFGGVCLLGVLAGMILQIRAYLVLGCLFLALDVVANLLAVGLRDHRAGFWILSLAGLVILGSMVLTTLKRDEFRALLARLRARLSSWD